jgi:ketosteroid isomerase-like protein
MTDIAKIAHAFFEACETGKGWAVCRAWCTPDATFSAQAEPLLEIKTLAGYCDWMQGLMTVLTDGAYHIKSFATDAERQNVTAFAVFTGTHLAGGPVPPTGRKVEADYVYCMQFTGDKITHMTKIWHSWISLQQLGWA